MTIRPMISTFIATFLMLGSTAQSDDQTRSFTLNNLKQHNIQADYIIVVTTSSLAEVNKLATLRETKNNLRVAVVTIEQIDSTFTTFASKDSALKEFIGYALANWQEPKPQFLLLAGNVNLIPGHKEWYSIPDVFSDSVYVDRWFAEFGDPAPFYRLPHIALGRLPSESDIQLKAIISKILSYESEPVASWTHRAISVADFDTVSGSFFEDYAYMQLRQLQKVLPDTMSVQVRPSSPFHRNTTSFINLINEGGSILIFNGLMSSSLYSRSGYFSVSHVESLKNQSKLPFTIIIGPQRFELGDSGCIATKLLTTESGGAIATLAPSAPIYVFSGGPDFVPQFLDSTFAHQEVTVGMPFLSLQRVSVFQNDRFWTILGDPALNIKRPKVTSVPIFDSRQHTKFVLNQNYPNPFNSSTVFSFDLPEEARVTISIFDALGRRVELINLGLLRTGMHSFRWESHNLASGIYRYQLHAGSQMQTRTLVLIK